MIAAAIVVAAAPSTSRFIEETYSRRIYLHLQNVLTSFSNLVPFAFLDLLILGGIAMVGGMWIAGFRQSHSGTRVRTAFRLSVTTIGIAALLYLCFMGTWGLNYRRVPLREQLDFNADRLTQTETLRLVGVAVDQLNALAVGAHAQGWPEAYATPEGLLAGFRQTQRDLALEPSAVPGRPKRSLIDLYLSYSTVDGMTDPFFLEIIVSSTTLPFERPFVIAHEWAHLAGFADESDANFVGWLICLRGDVPARYSGWLFLYSYLLGELPRDDRKEVHQRLDARPKRDLQEAADRRRKAHPMLRRIETRVYDRFLKINRVEAGIVSYEGVVELVLGTRFGEGWTPALRGTGQ